MARRKTPHKEPVIEVGCWISTPDHPRAVCIRVDEDFVGFRYEARRGVDPEGEILWVENGEELILCTRIAPPDDASLAVVGLRGPYGGDQ